MIAGAVAGRFGFLFREVRGQSFTTLPTAFGPMLRRLGLAGLFVLALGMADRVSADGPLASATLEILGTRLSIHPDDVAQVVNVGEQARVRTCYGTAGEACGSAASFESGVAGLEVRAELRGPELPQAVPVSTVAGGTFLLPGFQQEGDYRLENIRLVDPATNSVV